MPLYLSWGLKNFDLTLGWDVYIPTGRYVQGGNDNTGLGFWSNVFQAFGYWYPEKVEGKPSKALAIMLGLSLELTSKIKDADETATGFHWIMVSVNTCPPILSWVFMVVTTGRSLTTRAARYWDPAIKDR
jgi:hypothetical protein